MTPRMRRGLAVLGLGSCLLAPFLFAFVCGPALASSAPAAPPKNTELPKISGTATEGHKLSTTNGKWSGNPKSYTYQWQACDRSGANCVPISGATLSTYTIAGSVVGYTIRSVVKARNKVGPSSATSSPTAAISSSTRNWVGVAQTVLVGTTPTGKLSGKPQVFTTFSANGAGSATLKVPMSTSGFRNLSDFGTPPIKNGYAVWHLKLNGTTSQRSTAHYPKAKLPLQVAVAYELDGKKMKAGDIVGKTGKLKVTYVIKNVTTKPTTVTFKNVFGKQQKTTVKTPVPIAAQLAITLPAGFTHLSSPNASASGNGNGTTSISWSPLLFEPFGGVKQSISYQAHVTDAVVPAATLSAAVLPPTAAKPLPNINLVGAPAVPVLTLGANLAKLQIAANSARAKLAAAASAALSAFKKVAVPALKGVSAKAATASTNAQATALALAQGSAGATAASGGAADVRGRLNLGALAVAAAAARMTLVRDGLVLAAARSATAAKQAHDVRVGLEALPPATQKTLAYRALHRRVLRLEVVLRVHAARVALTAVRAGVVRARLAVNAGRLRVAAVRARLLGLRLDRLSRQLRRKSAYASSVLAQLANAVSARAAKAAATLAAASVRNRQRKVVKGVQVGGGAQLDQAVAQLNKQIVQAGNKIDNSYAYLIALQKRAAANQLPAGNAIGTTHQVGAFVYSIAGANNSDRQLKLANFIGGLALLIGIGIGISLYRIRRGLPSSMASPKKAPAATKGVTT